MKTVFYLYLILLSLTLLADIEEITITADKPSTINLDSSMTSTTIIGAEEIKARQYQTLYQALKDVPGVDVVATAPGQTASLFIRGEKSEQTLVLIDGVEFNDPTDPGRGADLGTLRMENIERVEVIRGAQSVQYPGVGSVIQITTKSGKNSPPKLQLSMEAGSFGTFRSDINYRGNDKNGADYSFSVGLFSTDGISSARAGTEKDGSRNKTFSTKVGKDLSKNSRAELIARYYDSKTDLDSPPTDISNFKATQQNLLLRIQAQSKWGLWEPVLGFNYRSIDRNSLNYGSTPNTRFISEGRIYKTDFTNRFSLSENHLVTFTLETEKQTANFQSDYGFGANGTNQDVTQSTGWLQYDLISDNSLAATLGARIDYHRSFQWEPTFRAAPSYKIKTSGTTLRSAIGTGFKAPSIYQLYGEYKNSALKPEKSFLFDVGVEQIIIPNRLLIILTGFYNQLREMVDFDIPNNRYINIGKAKTKGVEATLSAILVDELKISTAYTYLETEDEATHDTLLRRPRNKVSNTILFKNKGWETSFTHQLIGSRTDLDATSFARKEMPSYHLFNIALSYQLFSNTLLTGRIDNILDTNYQVIDGYGTPGIAFYAGFVQSL